MRICRSWEPAYAPSRISMFLGPALRMQSSKMEDQVCQRRLPKGMQDPCSLMYEKVATSVGPIES